MSSSISSNLARVPQTLNNSVMLRSLLQTQRRLLNTQIQLASGLAVNRPSDDAVASSAISVFDDVIERRSQILRNLTHGEGLLNNVDAALAGATDIVQEAKSIAVSQIGVGSDADTRANQANVVTEMINGMFSLGNREYQGIHFFGGSRTAKPPLEDRFGFVQYQGSGTGQTTDLGLARPFPITLSGDEAFGALSARVEGDHDLNPDLTLDTRLTDLNGVKGFGVRLGAINADIGGTNVTIDLTTAHTMRDVINTLNTALQAVDPGASVQIDPSDPSRIQIRPTVPVTISDLSAEATAADLGIDRSFPAGVPTSGGDLNPRITELTPLSALNGVTVPLGTIRLVNGGQTRDLDLSTANTVQDIMNAVEGLNIGIRVEISDSGDRLNFINQLSGGQMSVGEVAGGATATELGIRSLGGTTLLADFNDGQGVAIRSGSVDPITGSPDPTADLDFRVTLKDGKFFEVDLAGAVTVQDVLDAVNTAAGAASIAVPGQFEATLASDGNGIALVDNTTGAAGAETSVVSLNGSFAAENLGILQSTTGAILAGEDRATVAVDGVFAHLIALRDALANNDEQGIERAGQQFSNDIDRIARSRADVGVRTNRVVDITDREEDLLIQDESLRSEVRDLDYTEAALRFSTLQQQLQASLTTTSRISALSLLDFIR